MDALVVLAETMASHEMVTDENVSVAIDVSQAPDRVTVQFTYSLIDLRDADDGLVVFFNHEDPEPGDVAEMRFNPGWENGIDNAADGIIDQTRV